MEGQRFDQQNTIANIIRRNSLRKTLKCLARNIVPISFTIHIFCWLMAMQKSMDGMYAYFISGISLFAICLLCGAKQNND